VGTVLLILGASWVFGELVSAFNIIWGVTAPKGSGAIYWVRSTFTSFALVLAGVFLLLVSMIISAILAAAGDFVRGSLPGGDTLWLVVHTVVTIAVLTSIFALLMKWLPQTRVAWGDVWLGALLTAILWSILQFAIAYYIAFSSFKDYGPVGAMLALIAWVYLSAQILFVGGEFTVVYANRYGSRSQEQPATPAPGPVQTA
jgi:membrane protein